MFIRNRIAVFLFQFGIQKGDRAVGGDAVAVVVRGVVSERAERKSVAVKVFGIAHQSQDKVSAPYIVRQVTEKMTPMRVITHVLDNRTAVCKPVGLFEFFTSGLGETLQKYRAYVGVPHAVNDGFMRKDGVGFGLG